MITPDTPPSVTVNAVRVSVGEQDAAVSLPGLTPGFVGIYQIKATVSREVTPNDQAPVTITVAGQTSTGPPITVR